MTENEVFERLQRAIERRFGVSSLPFSLTLRSEGFGAKCWRMTDLESGSWIESTIYSATRRIYIHREHDGATTQ